MRREVARHAGAEVKTEGDSFYVVFSSASSGLECAVAILRRARTQAERHPDAALRIGIGLHAGETVSYDDQFVGSAVNIASRLASKAQAGEIVISDTLRGLVRTAHSYELDDRGALRLKGVAERVRAWSVRWDDRPSAAPRKAKEALPLPSAAPARVAVTGQLLCPVVVGREDELARVRPLLERARAGSGGALVVGGEAGVGKTAFVREIEKLATDHGFRLLSGATLEAEATVPYAPFLAAIRAGFRELTRDELGALLARVSPELAALFPEMGRSAAHRGASSSGIERHRLAISFQWLFATLARECPLLVVIDDLQWADEASLALVEQLARELRAAPAALVCAYRSDELHRRHPLVRTLAVLRRERIATEVALRRLDAQEVASLIQYAFGLANPPGDEFRDAIYARAEGNPFFSEELLKSLVESGDIFRTATGWDRKPIEQLRIPGSVREAVRARIERLPRDTQATLEAGAVLGSRFTFDTLAHVRDLDEATLAEQLRECIDLQLIVELQDPVPTYEFRHALTREVIYDGLLLPERRRLHLRAAVTLEAAGDTPPALLAEQWRLGGDHEKAAGAFEAAGQAALALHAPEEAVAHFEAAIESRGEARLEHYLGLARGYLALDVAKARDAAERGLALLPADADLARRIELMNIAGRARWYMGDSDGNFELARSAVALVESEPEGWTKARAYEWQASALMVRDDHAGAAEWAQRALEVATRIGDSAVEASALITLATVTGRERPAAGLELIEEAAAVARRGAPEALSRAHISGLTLSFRVESARTRFVRLERAIAFSERYGYGRAQILGFRALHCFLEGDWSGHGSFGVSGDPAAHRSVGLVRVLEGVARAARDGPTAEVLEPLAAVVRRAIATNEPQWRVPAFAFEAVALHWARRGEELRARIEELLRSSERAAAPRLALTDLCGGLDAAAVALLASRRRDILLEMATALDQAYGRGGDREALRAFIAWLDGDDATALREFSAAAPALEERGLPFRIAVDVHALARVRPLGTGWDRLVAKADAALERAGAAWLRADLRSLVASHPPT